MPLDPLDILTGRRPTILPDLVKSHYLRREAKPGGGFKYFYHPNTDHEWHGSMGGGSVEKETEHGVYTAREHPQNPGHFQVRFAPRVSDYNGGGIDHDAGYHLGKHTDPDARPFHEGGMKNVDRMVHAHHATVGKFHGELRALDEHVARTDRIGHRPGSAEASQHNLKHAEALSGLTHAHRYATMNPEAAQRSKARVEAHLDAIGITKHRDSAKAHEPGSGKGDAQWGNYHEPGSFAKDHDPFGAGDYSGSRGVKATSADSHGRQARQHAELATAEAGKGADHDPNVVQYHQEMAAAHRVAQLTGAHSNGADRHARAASVAADKIKASVQKSDVDPLDLLKSVNPAPGSRIRMGAVDAVVARDVTPGERSRRTGMQPPQAGATQTLVLRSEDTAVHDPFARAPGGRMLPPNTGLRRK